MKTGGNSAKGGVGVFDSGAIDVPALGAEWIRLAGCAVVNPFASACFEVGKASGGEVSAIAFSISVVLAKVCDVVKARVLPTLNAIAQRLAGDFLYFDGLSAFAHCLVGQSVLRRAMMCLASSAVM